MGRNRSFDEAEVVAAAAGAFVRTGYEGTSVDDLVGATGLFRGSLYKAFGSKRGLFVSALESALERAAGEVTDGDLDLLLVALLDVAPTDDGVRSICAAMVDTLHGDQPARALGTRLLARAGLAAPSETGTTLRGTERRK